MRYRIKLYKDGRLEVSQRVSHLTRSKAGEASVEDWLREWKTYNQLKDDWEIRITPEEE